MYMQMIGIQHIVRGILTDEAIKNKDNTNVLSRLSNGFGYSWNLFYGPFSSFSLVICHFIFRNWILAYKVLLFLGIIFSGISMYFLVKKITKSQNIAMFASILYMTAQIGRAHV